MKTRIFIFLLFLVTISNIKAVELEGGIYNSGSKLQIYIEPVGGSFNSDIHAVQFAIKYSSSYTGVTFGTPSTPTGIALSYQETQTSGGYIYQFYSWRNDASPYTPTPTWSDGSQNLIMEVTISGGTGTGDFSLVSGSGESNVGGADPRWYVESPSLPGGYSDELYQATATSVPLPVELSSFSALVNTNNVNLSWKTATEVNNNGFEVQREAGSQKSESRGQWEKVGFVQGHGNSNSPKEYRFTDKSLAGGTNFVYRLKQIDNDGQYQYSKEVEVEVVPKQFALYQNYPNPFNPETNIKFDLPEVSKVRVNVYNILGERVATLLDKTVEAGFHQVEFNGSNLSSGTYIYRIEAGNFVQTKKMVLLK